MKVRLVRFGSLRVRVTLAMLALAAFGSSIFAFSVYIAAERMEQSVLNRHIQTEFEALAAQVRMDPDLKVIHSALLLGFVGHNNPEVPTEFSSLPIGSYHNVSVNEKAYQVYVGEDRGKRLYVGYDITQWEALEQPVINTLIAGVAIWSLLAIVLGFWASSQVIAPVTALAKRLQMLDPRQRKVRIAPDFSGAEVSAIAESFDRYMERLDGFVEREQLFTSAAAHELRTPLTVIQGATEVLAELPALPPPAQRATSRLQRATRDMREFIEALLFLSREGQHGVDSATCELSRIIRQLAEDSRRLINSTSLALDILSLDQLWLDAPPALPTIVVSNLLRNAIEHTEAGKIQVSLDGRTLRIVDTGLGIPEQAQAALFDRDYSTKEGGGMGLHLTKRICDRFGWALKITSGVGEGTTASVTF